MRNFIILKRTEELILIYGANKEINPIQVIDKLKDVFINNDFDKDYKLSLIKNRYFI